MIEKLEKLRAIQTTRKFFFAGIRSKSIST